jgi:hypothetical protein
MPTFATPGPIAATVQVAGAQVRVTASDRTDTVVLVEPIDETSRRDVKVAGRTRVDFAGGQLSVKTTVPGDPSGSVAITVELPTGSSLVAYLAHSGVHAEGALGECELHMASGRVHLDRITALQANVGSGEVAIGHASADVELRGASGGLDIKSADGSVTATTASGDIRIGISEGTAASIDVDSERGVVHDFLSAEGTADRPHRRVTVHARTRYGDITVQRAAS